MLRTRHSESFGPASGAASVAFSIAAMGPCSWPHALPAYIPDNGWRARAAFADPRLSATGTHFVCS